MREEFIMTQTFIVKLGLHRHPAMMHMEYAEEQVKWSTAHIFTVSFTLFL